MSKLQRMSNDRVKANINETLTRQVAHLARLQLTDSEVETFTQQIGEILKYVDTLQAVDVTGIEPLMHALPLSPAFREDVAREFGRDAEGQPKTLASAPDVLNGGYKVPQVI